MNNNYNNWDNWYSKIIKDFNFNEKEDYLAGKLLDELLDNKIEVSPSTNKCVIFGAGPSIKKDIDFIKDNYNLNEYCVISADGTTQALLEENMVPDIIVSDLDGDINSIIEANKKGSILFIHAHGDNIDKIKEYLPLLDNIVPTTQNKIVGKLENYGGFTDGDRAVHIAVYKLNMSEIILAGMDFGDIVTRYSRPDNKNMLEKADNIKKLKLDYAKAILNSLEENNPNVKFIWLNKS